MTSTDASEALPARLSPPTPPALLSPAELRGHFDVRPGYLAACTMGVPPRSSVEALTADLADWSHGHPEAGRYGAAVEQARSAYARLVSVPAEQVAVGSQVSVQASLVAASLPEGAEVLLVDGDFSSMVFPFLVQQQLGRLSVRCVPLESLAAAVLPSTALVAFSLVQSATGAIADAEAVLEAVGRHGAATFCDTTQACGWMPVDASRFDVTVCHTYKWLCAPRGVSFMTVAPSYQEKLVPAQAGWYAGSDVWGSCYGPAMALAPGARRFDVSPAWQAWLGAAPALELFARADLEAVRESCTALATTLCERIGVPPTGSAIAAWPDPSGAAFAALTAAGVTASARAGRVRVAFHVWNTADDLELVCRALGV
jgi:selenocysteine lyase/cysteine desulfurase